jgi:hypothetical protein
MREPQYQQSIDLVSEKGLTTLGLMTNHAWQDDPRHVVFTLARYKFVAKMLSGRSNVPEIGCAVCIIVPTVNPANVTPRAEAFQVVIWRLLVSNPALKQSATKWESAAPAHR